MTDFQRPGPPPGDNQETVLPTSLLAGRYRIERVIGEGAFGRVYLAFDTRLRRNVAIKELLATRNTTDHATYERYLERFQREARATGTIQQPNVVTVYDLHVDAAGNNYLVLEYVDGTNLRDLLMQVGTLPEARTLAVAADVAQALEAVHDQEIVHRDVKPANIMLTRRGVAKLMDFGIARIAHEQQLTLTTGSHPGTPLYMSPEQASGYGYIDGRSDLYSLGLVIYEMLTGEPYGRRRQPLGAMRPDLPRPMIAVVDKLLAPDAAARYQSAGELLSDLREMQATLSGSPDAYPYPDTGGTPTISAPPAAWAPGAPTGTVTGVPSAYGGPTSQQPPGAPYYPPAAPPPSGIGAGGYPPPAYPPAPGYAFSPPPSGPPKRGNRGALLGIGGGLIAVLAVIGIFFFATRGGSDTTATATPGPSGATATTLNVTLGPGLNATATPGATVTATSAIATATRAATATVAASATPSATASRPAVTPSVAVTPGRTGTPGTAGQTTTWSEPNGLLTLKYPSNWTQTRDTSDNTNLVEFDGPGSGPFVYVYLNDPQQGTIQEEIQFIIKNQANGQKYTYTEQKITDLQISGQPAKMLTYTYTDKTDATKVYNGAWWVVNNNNKQYSILAGPLGNSRADADAIVNSIAFGNAKNATFTDADGILKLQYPTEWSRVTDASDKTNVLSLSGANDEVKVYIYSYPISGLTYDQKFKQIRDTDSDDGKTVRVYDPVLDTKVGGQPAKSLAYRYTAKDKPGSNPGIATIWLVDHNGKRYEFRCSNIALHRPEIEAMMGSVTFLK